MSARSVHKVEDPHISESDRQELQIRPHQAGSERNCSGSPMSSNPVHPEAVPVLAALQRTHRRLADILGAVLPSTERIFKARGQVQNRTTAVSATEEAQRYSQQCKQSAACAMFAHLSADFGQNKD
jgi:hypothetical protein